jgi:hypothetical protein
MPEPEGLPMTILDPITGQGSLALRARKEGTEYALAQAGDAPNYCTLLFRLRAAHYLSEHQRIGRQWRTGAEDMVIFGMM